MPSLKSALAPTTAIAAFGGGRGYYRRCSFWKFGLRTRRSRQRILKNHQPRELESRGGGGADNLGGALKDFRYAGSLFMGDRDSPAGVLADMSLPALLGRDPVLGAT